MGGLEFVMEGKSGEPGENHQSKARINDKLNPHIAPGQDHTWTTLVLHGRFSGFKSLPLQKC